METEFQYHKEHRLSNPNLPKYEEDLDTVQETKHKELPSSSSDEKTEEDSKLVSEMSPASP